MLRLTLRTLLAYLDDTLQPAESRDIGQQIAQEPAINDLVMRIRNVMRRRRLLADSADPDHAEVDPNDVAEYLDNVLTPSRIADLEKRLLEHDSDLAEVASVHQILSLVLGRPSEIPTRAKERAYKLVRAKGRSHLELDPIGPTRGGSTGIVAEPGPLGGPSSISEGAPSFSIGMGALVALLIGLLGITLYFVIAGQKDRPMPPIAQGDRSDRVAEPERSGEASSPAGSDSTRSTPAPEAPSVPSEGRPADSIIPETTTSDTAVSPTKNGSPEVPTAPVPSLSPPDASEPEVTQTVLPKDELDSLPGVDPDVPVKPADEPLTTPEPKTKAGSEKEEAKGEESATEESNPSKDVTKDGAEPVVPPVEQRSVPVATYVSQTGILLRQADGVWSRLTPRSKLQSGEEIAYAEPSRAKIELPTGVIIEMTGPTRIGLNFNPAVDFSFHWDRGRLLFYSSSEPTSIEMKVGDESGTLLLDDAGTRVAGEREPTISADGKSVVWQLDLYSLEGTFEWTSAGERVSVTAGNKLRIRGDDTVLPVAESSSEPVWSSKSADGPTEKLLGRLSDEIPFNTNPIDRYRELINDNNKDTRLLAVEALASMKQVDALAEGIRHPKYEPIRRASLASLRSMILEGAEDRQLVKGALDKVYGVDGAKLLQILESPTVGRSRPRDLVKGWIGELDAAELAIREGAISQLMLLTGRDLEYSAESTSSQRKTVIGRWMKWLDSQSDDQLAKLVASAL